MKLKKYQEIRQRLLKQIRGLKSQTFINRKLGMISNQISRWETGKSHLTWSNFYQICEITDTPLAAALRISLVHLGSPKDCSVIVKYCSANNTAKLSKKMKVSASTISRWRSGKLEPNLDQMLQMIDVSTNSLELFLSVLLKQVVPEVSLSEKKLQDFERSLHYRSPVLGALLLCLRMPECQNLKSKHEEFLAKKLKISKEDVIQLIQDLIQVGAIEKKNQFYFPRLNQLNLGGDRKGNLLLRQYWMKRSMEFLKSDNSNIFSLKTKGNEVVWPFLVFNCSLKDFELIQQKLVDFHREISELTTDCEDDNHVFLFSAQLFDIEDLPQIP